MIFAARRQGSVRMRMDNCGAGGHDLHAAVVMPPGKGNTMNRTIQTDKAPPSFSAYSQAVEVPANARTVYVSGQVGADAEGRIPKDPETQHVLAWRNVFAILEAAGMAKADIVDVFAIVTAQDGVKTFREVRDRMFGGHLACSTIMIAGLASPDWKIEIAVRAARVD
jgi:enamine deaminase RidA (YjgF/YER057c/UK114 family)